MFTPAEFSRKMDERNEALFAKYTGLVDQCIEQQLSKPDIYLEWMRNRRLSIPLSLDAKGEEELFRGLNLTGKKQLMDMLAKQLQEQFCNCGWYARVSASWLELRPRRRKSKSNNGSNLLTVITGGKG